MPTLHFAVVGHSYSLSDLIKSFSDEGFSVFVHFILHLTGLTFSNNRMI